MTPFSIHLGYVLGALPFPDRFARARELGFRAVEIPFPYAVPAEEYAALLQLHGLQQISIGTPTGDYRKGEVGFAVDPDLRSEFRKSVEQAAAYAIRIGAPAIHVFSGCRNPGLSAAVTEETYCENLATTAAILADQGIIALIEPINDNDFPGYHLNSLDEALRVIAKVGSDNIRLIFDVYHVRAMKEDPVTAIRAAHRYIEHIQFADFPGRHEPGSGTLDFAGIITTLQEVGYDRSAGLEYNPTRPLSEPLILPPALAEYAGLVDAGP